MTNDHNLGNDLDDMLDDQHDPNTTYTDSTRTATNDFREEPKYTAPPLENDLGAPTKEGKNIALISHLTIIGWIVAIVMNSNTKSEFASFYIRQVLGLGLCLLVLNFIPFLGWILSIGIIVLWIMSLIAAAGGEKKLTPVLGAYFQDWFKSL